MEKISFTLNETGEEVLFYVLEETRLNGTDYILVTDSQEDDGEALILKDLSSDGDSEALYEIVDDDRELESVMEIFEQLLEDVDITLE
ncbi:hypothetical protein B5E77_07190 [Lachnoclostridium sp. An131]|jgi:uncharacterized protein YrzB (UPF0473 family)|uniref:DUF1292 domain-containing protein n=1 Tax=Lachnoclostridium sp. An131 TaxID=1965555 RepID=UPI000B3AE15E|nr:DUF1292 domain-containing protein [Lachnoclostridium sp. An131]OUQ27323.1 hypothetical protein B5E77_07190 [Lachnoclostridium sp. An131]